MRSLLQQKFNILVAFSIFAIFCGLALIWQEGFLPPLHLPSLHTTVLQSADLTPHPISYLLSRARLQHSPLLSKRTTTLHTAAQAYRSARGRHPPPGFDVWFSFAQSHNTVFIEDLFSQIYHDLTPFWGVPAGELRAFAQGFEHRIVVRNGSATATSYHGPGAMREWMESWLELVRTLEGLVPDLDVAVNLMDESRVIVPWETINHAVKIERATRNLPPKSEVDAKLGSLSIYQSSPSLPESSTASVSGRDWLNTGSFWDIARVGCAPDSPARMSNTTTNFTAPPPLPAGFPDHSSGGYVQNWTLARNVCQQPLLRELHGSFIEPVSINTTHDLVPIFGGSKLTGLNQDILIPPAAYLSNSFSGGVYAGTNDPGPPWEEKKAGAVWRGVASGGRNREENWKRFHRHRFVAMLNGTAVEHAETNPDAPHQGENFHLQSYSVYGLTATKLMDLGSWLKRVTNVGFTNLECFPTIDDRTCSYTSPYFTLVSTISMAKQYAYKLLPDPDGNSFSGRYLAFLRSTSAPIKATIYSEWHDDRLTPWLHFIPMDNTYVDMYGILDYFLGTGQDDGAHDDEARSIADTGKSWADQVLRIEDMQVYMLRLLLEYARLCDDRRNDLAFVADIPEP